MQETSVLSENEKIALSQFKERLKDLNLENQDLMEDRRLINWLRARDLKLDAAESMFRKHLDWRQEFNIDTILKHGFNNIPEEALKML
ncbi:SEC14-like protein 4 [Orchesella cincta]|uniref:SEC14-like protein 4 n=1 Tax=Orchesella cincta TaxID=48709 RepID=A0A1D2NIE4_ORCCI|nr:SEC14-like protein 4 [Orchesella cincta]